MTCGNARIYVILKSAKMLNMKSDTPAHTQQQHILFGHTSQGSIFLWHSRCLMNASLLPPNPPSHTTRLARDSTVRQKSHQELRHESKYWFFWAIKWNREERNEMREWKSLQMEIQQGLLLLPQSSLIIGKKMLFFLPSGEDGRLQQS